MRSRNLHLKAKFLTSWLAKKQQMSANFINKSKINKSAEKNCNYVHISSPIASRLKERADSHEKLDKI